ncbi:MAG: hypothetical protein OXN18_15530 [Gemmatimonadota bacterium]|nr:hypothetical protein [Gemmatimonadota bacterium]
MTKKLTELVKEVLAKGDTKEGRRELREKREGASKEAASKAAAEAPGDSSGAENVQKVEDGDEEVEGMRAVTRVDPILPALSGAKVLEPAAREAGRLAFGGLVEGRENLAETQLPLFDLGQEGPRVAMLELADARGGPVMARGRGAPLDLRLFVAACVMTPKAAREGRTPLVTSVRELRDFCFPNGWQRNRDWPALRAALGRARDYAIPWVVGTTAGGWWPVAVRFAPGRDAQLDDQVILDVMLPPGCGAGPMIARPELVQLGVTSAPRFRAYIAVHSVAWRPGVTRRRHPRHPDVHLWSSDPANYLVLTRADRRRLAFGAEDKGNRTRAQQDAAWERLPGVKILSRSATSREGRRGWLVVPEAAATAISRAGEEGGRQRFGG